MGNILNLIVISPSIECGGPSSAHKGLHGPWTSNHTVTRLKFLSAEFFERSLQGHDRDTVQKYYNLFAISLQQSFNYLARPAVNAGYPAEPRNYPNIVVSQPSRVMDS